MYNIQKIDLVDKLKNQAELMRRKADVFDMVANEIIPKTDYISEPKKSKEEIKKRFIEKLKQDTELLQDLGMDMSDPITLDVINELATKYAER